MLRYCARLCRALPYNHSLPTGAALPSPPHLLGTYPYRRFIYTVLPPSTWLPHRCQSLACKPRQAAKRPTATLPWYNSPSLQGREAIFSPWLGHQLSPHQTVQSAAYMNCSCRDTQYADPAHLSPASHRQIPHTTRHFCFPHLC